eukprot:gene22747-29454_t
MVRYYDSYMPQVNFLGNNNWSLKNGVVYSETHSSSANNVNGIAIFNHPIEVCYDTSTAEGWPVLVVEAWEKSENNRQFVGCGSVWLPSTSVDNIIEINIWRPCNSYFDSWQDILLPTNPDLKRLRELVMNPYQRNQIKTVSAGIVRISVSVVLAGFERNGVFA